MARLSAPLIVRDLVDRVLSNPASKGRAGVVIRVQPCERRFKIEVRHDENEPPHTDTVLALVVVARPEVAYVRNLLCDRLSENFESIRTVNVPTNRSSVGW